MRKEPNLDTLGGRILYLVCKSHLTLAELEKNTGISSSSWSHYISGKHVPETRIIILICEYFNCSADWLMLGKDVQPKVSKMDILKNAILEELSKKDGKDLVVRISRE